ncbi:MAG: glycosyltransferase [Pirellulaceae bacterium]|nr:glycosyltransferase [Pirellulaceae bacterium]
MNIRQRIDSEEGIELFDRHKSHRPAVPKERRLNRRPRIAFYSHDTMGMGHLRRNMLIASALSAGQCQADTLLIAGTREAGFFAEQAGLDCVTLPALTKNRDGNYAARHYNWSLEETTRLRSRVIASTLLAFRPDILVVDKLPQGICNELQRTLKLVRNRVQTHCVLGLRDVLDDPHVAIPEWTRSNNDQIIEDYFDEVWVYGDPAIYDCRTEYQFSKSTLDRVFFTGYLDQQSRLVPSAPTSNAERPLALCLVGGGQDGVGLAKAFVKGGVPAGWQGVVITGPFMPVSDKQQLTQAAAATLAGSLEGSVAASSGSVASGPITIIDQLVEADDYVRKADRVVAMGGYNTVMSVLSFRKPALIVPRTRPRTEQWIRAERLAAANLISTLHPTELTPAAIRDWLSQPKVADPRQHTIDLNGLDRIQSRVLDIAGKSLCVV